MKVESSSNVLQCTYIIITILYCTRLNNGKNVSQKTRCESLARAQISPLHKLKRGRKPYEFAVGFCILYQDVSVRVYF